MSDKNEVEETVATLTLGVTAYEENLLLLVNAIITKITASREKINKLNSLLISGRSQQTGLPPNRKVDVKFEIIESVLWGHLSFLNHLEYIIKFQMAVRDREDGTIAQP